jgi:hypothetical protein
MVDGGVVVDPSLMRDVWVDLEAGVARGELDRETQALGLAVTGASRTLA